MRQDVEQFFAIAFVAHYRRGRRWERGAVVVGGQVWVPRAGPHTLDGLLRTLADFTSACADTGGLTPAQVPVQYREK